MRTALGIVNIVTEAEYIFMELIHKLKCYFNRNAFALTLEINNIMNRFLRLVHILDKTDNTFRLMELNMLI